MKEFPPPLISIIHKPTICCCIKDCRLISFPQVLANVGATENIGFEAALNLRVIDKKDFRWNSDLTFSTNSDKIVSLASGETKDVSNPDNALVVGEPVRAFYDYEADGCWSIDEADQAADI